MGGWQNFTMKRLESSIRPQNSSGPRKFHNHCASITHCGGGIIIYLRICTEILHLLNWRNKTSVRGCEDAQVASWPQLSVSCVCVCVCVCVRVYCWKHFRVLRCPAPPTVSSLCVCVCTHATVSLLILSQSERSRPITKTTILQCKHTSTGLHTHIHTYTHTLAHGAVTLRSPVNSLQCLLFPLCRYRPKRQCCVQLIPLFRLCWRPLASTMHCMSWGKECFICVPVCVTHITDCVAPRAALASYQYCLFGLCLSSVNTPAPPKPNPMCLAEPVLVFLSLSPWLRLTQPSSQPHNTRTAPECGVRVYTACGLGFLCVAMAKGRKCCLD